MTNWIADYQVALCRTEDLLRQAQGYQRLVRSKRFQELPAILKSLLVILS
jgi:hypothetical protein